MAAEGNPTVQMVLPMAEMIGWLRRGVGEPIRQAGLQLIGLLSDEEVGQLVGERGRPSPKRKANRWSTERGYCTVMGQKAPVERPPLPLRRRAVCPKSSRGRFDVSNVSAVTLPAGNRSHLPSVTLWKLIYFQCHA
jgi:hypothetical protein